MCCSQEIELAQKYKAEIIQRYNERSRVPALASLQRENNNEAPGFLQIGKKWRIPRTLFDENRVIIVYPFARFIELSEYQYVIDTLRETSRRVFQSETSPTERMINNAIVAISGLTDPNYIIIPIAFYVDLHALSRASNSPLICYEEGQAFYIHAGRRLRVLWSNKSINLNEIIIGNSRDGLWIFKSAENANRLTVKFTFNDVGNDAILLVKTIFRFRPPIPERISVIHFPQYICNIESRTLENSPNGDFPL